MDFYTMKPDEPIFLKQEEPIFNDTRHFEGVLEYVLCIIAAIVAGCFGIVNRSWTKDDDQQDKWWQAEQHYWDNEYTDPKQHWDGHEYRAISND